MGSFFIVGARFEREFKTRDSNSGADEVQTQQSLAASWCPA